MQKAAIPSKTATSGSFSKPWTLVLQAHQVIHAARGLCWAAGAAKADNSQRQCFTSNQAFPLVSTRWGPHKHGKLLL